MLIVALVRIVIAVDVQSIDASAARWQDTGDKPPLVQSWTLRGSEK